MARPRKYKTDADRQRAGRARRKVEAETPGQFRRVSDAAGTVHVRQPDEPPPPPALLDARTKRARNGRDSDPLTELGYVPGADGPDGTFRARRNPRAEEIGRNLAAAYPIDDEADHGAGYAVLVPAEFQVPAAR